jgi:hypothetical protein
MHKISKLHLIIAGLVLLAAYCLPPAAYCQTTGGIKGKLRNLNGQGIGGATITARQNGKDLKSATSTGKGDFQLDGLESGVYNVVFDAKGYSSGVKYDVPVQSGKIRDLGANLIMQVDRGSFVIVNGSVFFKSGHSIPGAEVKVERINGDGSLRKITTTYSDNSGEFGFRQEEGAAKFRITATYKGISASKDIEVDNAAIYRLSIILDVERGDK